VPRSASRPLTASIALLATLAVAGTHTLDELDADAHASGVDAVAVQVNADGSLTLVDRRP